MTTDDEYFVFATALGSCAVVWAQHGIIGVELPDDERAIRSRIARRFPHSVESAPTPEVREAVESIVALLSGERRDLRAIDVDMSRLTPFDRRVLETAREIPAGDTLTYGELASRIGHPTAAREVGGALGRNPFPIIVPCHRVLAAGGKSGGFSGTGGVATKLRLLAIERSAGPLFDDV
jgi:methylated-DNA-[protein]-cysteine S-methyltransferase